MTTRDWRGGVPKMADGFAAIMPGLRGPSFCPATACASGTHAIGEAFLHVAVGTADAIVAGGAESATSPLLIASFARMRALSTRNDDPAQAFQLFDRGRDGFVIGEGCGVAVLEEFEHARRRGRGRIYAELVGMACPPMRSHYHTAGGRSGYRTQHGGGPSDPPALPGSGGPLSRATEAAPRKSNLGSGV